MSRIELTNRYILRKDTEENWENNNPVLAAGEIGYDTTNKYFKIGDGTTAWKELKYYCEDDFSAVVSDISALKTRLDNNITIGDSTGSLESALDLIYDTVGEIQESVGSLGASDIGYGDSDVGNALDTITASVNDHSATLSTLGEDITSLAGDVSTKSAQYDQDIPALQAKTSYITSDGWVQSEYTIYGKNDYTHVENALDNLCAKTVNLDTSGSISSSNVSDETFASLGKHNVNSAMGYIKTLLNGIQTTLNNTNVKLTEWATIDFLKTNTQYHKWLIKDAAFEVIGIQITNITTTGASFSKIGFYPLSAITNETKLSWIGESMFAQLTVSGIQYHSPDECGSALLTIKLNPYSEDSPLLRCKARLIYKGYNIDSTIPSIN